MSRWMIGYLASYSCTIVKLGLVTRVSAPSAAARPCAKTVLPAPRSPVRLTTSPGSSVGASEAPTTRVSSAEVVTTERTFIDALEEPELLGPVRVLSLGLRGRRRCVDDRAGGV